MSSELVALVNYQDFEESIELITAQIGKPPAQGRAYELWLENKFDLIRHLPAKRWGDMVPVAFNSWRFWNEFTADWVQKCSAELYRLEQAKEPPKPMPAANPCPAWLGIWLKQCAEARAAGKPEPTPASIRESMLDRSLNPMEPRESLNQLIVQALTRAQPTAAKPAPAPPPEPQEVELWA